MTSTLDTGSASGFAEQLALDLDADDVRIVLEMFRQDVGRLASVLGHDAATGDVVTFRRDCHAMAGAAGAVGAQALVVACRHVMMQDELRPERLAEVAAQIRALAEAALAETSAFLAASS